MDIAVSQDAQHTRVSPAEKTAPARGSVGRFFANTWAITKKELNLYFSTPLAYVLLGVFIFLMGDFFIGMVGQYQTWTLRAQQIEQYQPGILDKLNFTDGVYAPLLGTAGIIYVFMIPFLTMRLIAEEKRQNTFQLLMTSPVRPWEIVFGKFISSQIVMAVSLALMLVFPVLLNTLAASGGVEWQVVLTVCIGYTLLTMALVSIGMFISSLAESPVSAAFITLGALLVLYVLLGYGARTLDAGLGKDVLEYASAASHIQGFLSGTLRLTDISYFLSITVLGLVLTRTAIERTRW